MSRTGIVIAVGVAAVVAVGAVAVIAASGTGSSTTDSAYAMMGGRYAYQPAQRTHVGTLAAAKADAQRLADRLGLRVDEVLEFQRNFYAKLVDDTGNGATEVLVDPGTGLVSVEYGPAMMWNTRYGIGRNASAMMGSYGASMMRGSGGMMGGSTPGGMMSGSGAGGMMGGASASAQTASSGSTTTAAVTMAGAHSLAQRWLSAHEPGVTVESGGDAFPGYYTLETLRSGRIAGMISVNAATGAVWPHWWHGAFIAKSG